MYLPKRFENGDIELSFDLMKRNPFATVISVGESGEPFVSHLPLVAERENDRLVLYGHLARANPHAKLLERSGGVYVIFHGPHAYITPKWYVENDVPTWNYAVVHVRGACTMIADFKGITECLKKLTAHIEGGNPDGWKFWLPEDLSDPAVVEKSIVGFRIHAESIQSKLKLNQNRSEADREGVITGLKERRDDLSRGVLELMENLR